MLLIQLQKILSQSSVQYLNTLNLCPLTEHTLIPNKLIPLQLTLLINQKSQLSL